MDAQKIIAAAFVHGYCNNQRSIPSIEQAHANARALGRALQDNGVACVINDAEGEVILDVLGCRLVFDQWGFVQLGETEPVGMKSELMAQSSLTTTVAYIEMRFLFREAQA